MGLLSRARSLGISIPEPGVNDDKWMFNYRRIGWSFYPTSPEQVEFLRENKKDYLNKEFLAEIQRQLRSRDYIYNTHFIFMTT